MITKEQVLEALSYVEEPDLKKDLVTLNMIQNIVIEDQKVSFEVVLTTPACPLKDHIEHACRNAIAHFIDKNIAVDVHMTSRVLGKEGNQLLGIKNIILVSSGKGGVGKSTVAANLALSLHAKGAKTGLLDADIYGPSLPIMFGLEGEKPQSVQHEDGTVKIQPIEKFGIKLLSIGFFTDPNQPIPWRGPMATSAIKQLLNDTDWGDLDYLVIDMPPGTGDIHITVAQNYPIAGAVIVTTPQHVALADAIKGMGMFLMDSINIPLLGIVENMAYFTPAELPENKYYIFGKGGGTRLAEEYKIPFLGEIPLLKGISDAGDNGFPIAIDEEDPTTKAFIAIAEKVAQQLSIIQAVR
ncbi:MULTISPECIES: Mrp/NBP35 family ATP-binding protein [Sphingobacterium]|jgi:ATP-binding protein involved in chromosome partitioning|uniref:Iron-sulfur cluster carrier protein n=2 Tax=Sphingobacterium TaxID=28453 RepID=A0ABW5Z2V6_9SPHI|nr:MULTISPECIES: Mrp/NBP35 family ATP-binding protein [Sphingobacterium]KKX47880.1 mrp [Sphingobacterium sp. IITKGP-BTPF85]MBB2953979.1 ATP-binding protein involved in chromosome partitioning [Sphingobacterium sp. JUb56]MCS3553325.1 ATP-binding protein involved in chromosome partitioning [Sphingobacterium sp. JUb21]MCW2262381.1 ATP-binding protein involved in chromosome partitioning [Sphingobacterium kitahiroshimense]NJI74721.1 Mrp/NBP35 family ATP-binding protein [Sphingobacterium sp. B16(202